MLYDTTSPLTEGKQVEAAVRAQPTHGEDAQEVQVQAARLPDIAAEPAEPAEASFVRGFLSISCRHVRTSARSTAALPSTLCAVFLERPVGSNQWEEQGIVLTTDSLVKFEHFACEATLSGPPLLPHANLFVAGQTGVVRESANPDYPAALELRLSPVEQELRVAVFDVSSGGELDQQDVVGQAQVLVSHMRETTAVFRLGGANEEGKIILRLDPG